MSEGRSASRFERTLTVTRDLASLARSLMRPRDQLAAKNLFLRKQLALYQERRAHGSSPVAWSSSTRGRAPRRQAHFAHQAPNTGAQRERDRVYALYKSLMM